MFLNILKNYWETFIKPKKSDETKMKEREVLVSSRTSLYFELSFSSYTLLFLPILLEAFIFFFSEIFCKMKEHRSRTSTSDPNLLLGLDWPTTMSLLALFLMPIFKSWRCPWEATTSKPGISLLLVICGFQVLFRHMDQKNWEVYALVTITSRRSLLSLREPLNSMRKILEKILGVEIIASLHENVWPFRIYNYKCSKPKIQS